MTDFARWFEESYGAPFPVKLGAQLVPAADGVWVSPGLRIESPPMVPEFLETAGDYVIAGSWGRGFNSYAFYFVEKRGEHRRFFRLQSGGVYTNPEACAKEIVAFLGAYERWKNEQEPSLEASTLINNMGDCVAELPTGAVETDDDTFFEEISRSE